MLSESTPVLSRAVAYFEIFMLQLEYVGESYKLLKPMTDIGYLWACKYYKKMDDNDVYIVTMCKFLNA